MPRRTISQPIIIERNGTSAYFFNNFPHVETFSLQVADDLLVTNSREHAAAFGSINAGEVGTSLFVIFTGRLDGTDVHRAYNFVRALRLVSPAPVFPAGSIFIEDDLQKTTFEEERGWSWGSATESITREDCLRAATIFPDVERVSNLEVEVFNRLSNAHRFFDNAYEQQNADMAIVGFTTALEGLLLDSDAELNFRF